MHLSHTTQKSLHLWTVWDGYYYRLGNIEVALEFLKKAFAIQEDPEIAAHLGEVLMANANEMMRLQKIWDESSANNLS